VPQLCNTTAALSPSVFLILLRALSHSLSLPLPLSHTHSPRAPSPLRGLSIAYVEQETGAFEPGVDAGGLTKEFFSSVLQEVTDDGLGKGGGDGGSFSEGSCVDDGPDASGVGSPLPPPPGRLLMRRQLSARGRGTPLFESMTDNSLMLTVSERPPM